MNKTGLAIVAALAVAVAVGGVFYVTKHARPTPLNQAPPPAVPATKPSTTKNDIAAGAIGLGSALIAAWSAK